MKMAFCGATQCERILAFSNITLRVTHIGRHRSDTDTKNLLIKAFLEGIPIKTFWVGVVDCLQICSCRDLRWMGRKTKKSFSFHREFAKNVLWEQQ